MLTNQFGAKQVIGCCAQLRCQGLAFSLSLQPQCVARTERTIWATPVGGRMPARGGAHQPDRVDSGQFGRSTKGPSIVRSHDQVTGRKEATLV